jgi:hypothetical protein
MTNGERRPPGRFFRSFFLPGVRPEERNRGDRMAGTEAGPRASNAAVADLLKRALASCETSRLLHRESIELRKTARALRRGTDESGRSPAARD